MWAKVSKIRKIDLEMRHFWPWRWPQPLYWSKIVSPAVLEVIQTQNVQKLETFGKFDLEIWLLDLEDDLRCYWKWHYRTRRPQKPRYRYRDHISSPSRSHSRPRLKLMLQIQVRNPEVATFQSFSKGVHVFDRQGAKYKLAQLFFETRCIFRLIFISYRRP